MHIKINMLISDKKLVIREIQKYVKSKKGKSICIVGKIKFDGYDCRFFHQQKNSDKKR